MKVAFGTRLSTKYNKVKPFNQANLANICLKNFLPRHCLLRNFLRGIWSSLSASEVGDFTQQCLLRPLTLLPSLFEHCTGDRLPWDALFRRERGPSINDVRKIVGKIDLRYKIQSTDHVLTGNPSCQMRGFVANALGEVRDREICLHFTMWCKKNFPLFEIPASFLPSKMASPCTANWP